PRWCSSGRLCSPWTGSAWSVIPLSPSVIPLAPVGHRRLQAQSGGQNLADLLVVVAVAQLLALLGGHALDCRFFRVDRRGQAAGAHPPRVGGRDLDLVAALAVPTGRGEAGPQGNPDRLRPLGHVSLA